MAPSGPFSHGARIPAGHDLIFTAGQIGTIDDKGTIAESYEAQVFAAISNLGHVIKDAGASVSDIVK